LPLGRELCAALAQRNATLAHDPEFPIRFRYRCAERGITSNDRKDVNIASNFRQRFTREDRVIEVRRDRDKTAG